MKYTIPYDDKITIPHIKKISTIGINTDNLYYDSRELSGKVIIDGEYLPDDSNDVMLFTHDIPVSFLIDDEAIDPQINISNFKYETIPGVGIEVMFELDVILIVQEEEVEEVALNQRIEEIDKQLEENKIQLEKLNNSSEQKRDDEDDAIVFSKQIDKHLDLLIGDRKEETIEKKPIEDVKEEEEVEAVIEDEEQVEKERIEIIMDEDKSTLLSVLEDEIKQDEEAKEIEILVEQENIKAEIEVEKIKTKLQSTNSSFDTGFISANNDKYTTYKILILEENESIDEVLNRKNLSKALVCDEFKSDSRKVILKIENDGN